MTKSYQVIARKYRPQSFNEVLGQDAIVVTLKNAIKNGRIAHAYLFCGSRGTGKTTLARVFAKAINCLNPNSSQEPCNQCASCREIAAGSSLDVLEIDGASNRGIDDVRQINDTVAYASSCGKHKIYIIDEVHMLTKEAFNALLKTLEEPPEKVLFIFATTEPHKVLPTILSRCQRFNLNRIPFDKIVEKLKIITLDQGIVIEEEALFMLADRADGAFRDAESLLDQIIAFNSGKIDVQIVSDVLGVMPKETFFMLDEAGKSERYAVAFDVVNTIFSQGKDLSHFLQGLIEHFRTLLLLKVSSSLSSYMAIAEREKARYESSSRLYTQEQLLLIIELGLECQNQMRSQLSGRVSLESLLIKIMRTHQRVPIEFLVKKLIELENSIQIKEGVSPLSNGNLSDTHILHATPVKISAPAPQEKQAATPPDVKVSKPEEVFNGVIAEDPTPSQADLGKKTIVADAIAPSASITPSHPPKNPQHRYDTILQFAAVELEGTIRKK